MAAAAAHHAPAPRASGSDHEPSTSPPNILCCPPGQQTRFFMSAGMHLQPISSCLTFTTLPPSERFALPGKVELPLVHNYMPVISVHLCMLMGCAFKDPGSRLSQRTPTFSFLQELALELRHRFKIFRDQNPHEPHDVRIFPQYQMTFKWLFT